MRAWRKSLLWGGLAALILAAAYIAYAGWRVASAADVILRVGTPIAQGRGMPAPQQPEDIGFSGDPAQAFGLAFETVEIATELGPAPAWLLQPEGSAGSRWAIVVHGIGGRRENGYRFLPALRAAGLPTLLISYRNGEDAPPSPDGLYALGLTEWRDLEAAVAFAGDNGATSVVLVGESMGGSIVGQFLRNSELAADIDAIVLDAPMLDLSDTLSAMIGKLGAPLPRTVTRAALWISSLRLPIDLSQAAVTAEFVAFPGPLFLSHGANDRIVPVTTSDRLVSERTWPTEYYRTSADHILSWKEDPARYNAALLAFLQSLPPPRGE